MADARHLAEVALLELLLQKAVDRLSAHKVARLKEETGFLDGLRHAISVFAPKSQRFFDEQVFVRAHGGHDDLFVPVRFRADDDGFYAIVRVNIVQSGDDLCVQLGRRSRGPVSVVVEDVFDLYFVSFVQSFDKVGRVDVGCADEGEGGHGWVSLGSLSSYFNA